MAHVIFFLSQENSLLGRSSFTATQTSSYKMPEGEHNNDRNKQLSWDADIYPDTSKLPRMSCKEYRTIFLEETIFNAWWYIDNLFHVGAWLCIIAALAGEGIEFLNALCVLCLIWQLARFIRHCIKFRFDFSDFVTNPIYVFVTSILDYPLVEANRCRLRDLGYTLRQVIVFALVVFFISGLIVHSCKYVIGVAIFLIVLCFLVMPVVFWLSLLFIDGQKGHNKYGAPPIDV